MLVVPEINAGTASLAYAVINPAVGLGSFLAQLFLRRPLMAASTREFNVQGSWADPKVERVERKLDAPLPDTRRARSGLRAATVKDVAMKIAALQTVSTPDVDRNLEAAARLIGAGRARGCASWLRCPSTSA